MYGEGGRGKGTIKWTQFQLFRKEELFFSSSEMGGGGINETNYGFVERNIQAQLLVPDLGMERHYFAIILLPVGGDI